MLIRRISPDWVSRSSWASIAGSRGASRSRLDSLQLGIDVAADDRLDVVDRGFRGAPAQLVGDAVRDDDRHPDDDGHGRGDDDGAEAWAPAKVRARSREGKEAEWAGMVLSATVRIVGAPAL